MTNKVTNEQGSFIHVQKQPKMVCLDSYTTFHIPKKDMIHVTLTPANGMNITYQFYKYNNKVNVINVFMLQTLSKDDLVMDFTHYTNTDKTDWILKLKEHNIALLN